LTTPNSERPFTGRPPRGRVHPPAPGVLVPDGPVDPRAASGATRLRALARRGPLVLDAARAAELDPSGELVETLGLRPGEAWVLRPDAHIGAIVDASRPDRIKAALCRAAGLPT
jgi:3-(3-hydroxy-phenyl)propionate hydroxylase